MLNVDQDRVYNGRREYQEHIDDPSTDADDVDDTARTHNSNTVPKNREIGFLSSIILSHGINRILVIVVICSEIMAVKEVLLVMVGKVEDQKIFLPCSCLVLII